MEQTANGITSVQTSVIPAPLTTNIADPRLPLGYVGYGTPVKYSEEADRRAVDIMRALYPNDPTKHSAWRADLVDPDTAFGEHTVAYGRLPGVDVEYKPTDVLTVNLFGGKPVSRERLMNELGPEGRALLAAVANARKHKQFDAVEALSDWDPLTFLPASTFLGKTDGSIRSAAIVNQVLDKIANQIPISDREAAILTLDLFTKQRKEHGTIAGRGWDVAKDAIPMMAEFYLVGGTLGGARTLAAKTVGKTSVGAASALAVPTVEKKLLSEITTEVVAKKLASSGEKFANPAAARSFLTSSPVRHKMIEDTVTEMLPRIAERMNGSHLPRNATAFAKSKEFLFGQGEYAADFVEKVTRNLATKSVDGAIASATRSNVFTKWAAGTVNWAKDHIVRGFLDHGSWADETASSLYTGFTTAKSALANAVGELFVQAPIKGSLMMAPNRFLIRPMIESFASAKDFDGNDIPLVGNQELSIKTGALLTGDMRKFEMAKQISDGIDFLEYVSESTGAGFSSFWNFAGIASKIMKPGKRILVGEVGSGMVRNLNVETGSALRKLIRKVTGTTQQYGERLERTQVKSVMAQLAASGATGIDESAVRDMVRTGVVPAAVSRFLGRDADRIIKKAVKDQAVKVADDEAYHTYAKYVIADLMFRNGWGTDQTIDALKRMGYHGMFNEMMEERYSEVAQGLFGVDAHTDHSFKARLLHACQNFETDLDKLAVEAFGFAIPGVSRNFAVMVQSSVGGTTEINRARLFGLKMRRAKAGMNIVESTASDYAQGMDAAKKNMETQRDTLRAELDSTVNSLRGKNVSDDVIALETSALRDRIGSLDLKISAHDENVQATLKANGIEDIAAVAAGKLINFAVVSSDYEKGSTRDKLHTVFTAKDVELAHIAENDVVADAAWVGEASYDAQNRWMGESSDQEVRSFWRKAASKLVGFSAAVMSGDPAIAAVNAIDWASVDEGGDPVTTAHLRETFARFRAEAIAKFHSESRRDYSEEELRNSFRDEYAREAKRYVNSTLLLNGLRMFSRTEMTDLALRNVAGQAGYSWNAATSMFEKSDGGHVSSVSRDAIMTDPSITVVKKDGTVSSVGEAVDDLVSKSAQAAIEMLSDPSAFSAVKGVDGMSTGLIKFLKLKPGDASVDMTAHCIAAQMASFRSADVAQGRELIEAVPIDKMLSENALKVPKRLVDSICDAYDAGGLDAVSDANVEEILRTISGDTLGKVSDESFSARKKSAVNLCKVARAASQMFPSRTFSVSVDMSKNRHYDANSVSLTFHRNKRTGKWRIDGKKYGSESPTLYTTEFTDDELNEATISRHLPGHVVRELDSGYVFTPYQTLVSADPMLFARKLGLGPALYKQGLRTIDGKLNDAAVHPALRINDDGSSKLTDAEVESALNTEMFMAKFYGLHQDDLASYNFENLDMSDEAVVKSLEDRVAEYKAMHDNVLAEKTGYMWRLNNALMKSGVTCPNTQSLAYTVAPGMRGLYVMQVSTYHSSAHTAETFVSVDYSKVLDGTAALTNAIVGRAVIANRHAFLPGGAFHDYVSEFISSFRSHADAAIFNPNTVDDMRTKLIAARDSLAANPEHPLLSSITQLVSAYVLGQIERAETTGHSATYHDAALAYIRKDVQSDFRPYIKFCAAIDVILGGTGFAQLRAMRKAKADMSGFTPSGGLMWLMNLLNEDQKVSGAVSKNFREILPTSMDGRRMSWDEFYQKSSEYLGQKVKNANNIPPVSERDLDPGLHPWQKCLNVLRDTMFENEDDVWDFLSEMFSPKGGPMESRVPGSSDVFMAAMVRRNNSKKQLEDSLVVLRNKVSELEGKLTAAESSGKESDDTINSLRVALSDANAEVANLTDLVKKLQDELASVRASALSGNSYPGPHGEEIADDEVDDGSEDGEIDENGNPAMLDSTFDFSQGRFPDISLDFADSMASVTVSRDVPFEAELDSRAIKFGAVIFEAAAASIVKGHTEGAPLTQEEFYSVVDRLTNNVAVEDLKSKMWAMYEEVVLARRRLAIRDDLEDPVVDVDLDQDDEGEQSNEKNEYNKTTLSMYDNKVLASFLQLAELVSPENGRELQGLLNSIRDQARRLVDDVEESGADDKSVGYHTAKYVFDLFNPRAIVKEGLRSQTDRDAYYYAEILDDLDRGDGTFNFREIVDELLSGEDPKSRKIAFFMLYLKSLTKGARKRFMELVGHSAQTRRYGVSSDSHGRLSLAPSRGRAQNVSEYAAAASFSKLLSFDGDKASVAKKVTELRASIMSEAEAAAKNGKFRSNSVADNLDAVADVLAKYLGSETPYVQALRSQSLRSTLVDRGREGMDLHIAFSEIAGGMQMKENEYKGEYSLPYAIRSVLYVLDTYASAISDDSRSSTGAYSSQSRRRELLSNIVLTEIQAGLRTESSRSANKTSSVSTLWRFVLGAYSASLPETVARANTIVTRNTKVGSKVVVSVPSNPPVLQQMMDRPDDDPNGFSYIAYRVWLANGSYGGAQYVNDRKFDGKATSDQLKEYFLGKVLPMCRQKMVWPDPVGRSIMAKNIDRDYSAEETYHACENYHNDGFLTRISAISSATSEKQRTDAIATASSDVVFVPIYAGEHSSGFTLQIPVSALYVDGGMFSDLQSVGSSSYKDLSKRVYKMLGFDQFGKDAKRSTISSCEIPGHSLRGIRTMPDGSLVKGEVRLHVFHNYSLDEIVDNRVEKSYNDSFLGTVVASGYGFDLQKEMSKDPYSTTLKLHIMSSFGSDMTLYKALITAMSGHSGDYKKYLDAVRAGHAPAKTLDGSRENPGLRGAFVQDSAERYILDHMLSGRNPDNMFDSLSCDIGLDEDSVKVGVLNSKTQGVVTSKFNRKSGEYETVTEPLMSYIFRKIFESGNHGKDLDEAALDEILKDDAGDGKFSWKTTDGTSRKTIGELLRKDEDGHPDTSSKVGSNLRVRVVKGLGSADRPALDLSFVDNTLTSHRVANVSHEAEVTRGKMARNNAVDAITLATLMKRSGVKDPDDNPVFASMLNVLTGWNILTAAAVTDPLTQQYILDKSDRIRRMMLEQGADRGSDAVVDQLAHDVFSELIENRNPVMSQIAAALVSSGARYKDGKVYDHCTDPFLRYIHRGGLKYRKTLADRLLATHRPGLSQINVRTPGFRYMMFVDETKLQSAYDEIYKAVGAASGETQVTSYSDTSAVIESIFNMVRFADGQHSSELKGLRDRFSSDRASFGDTSEAQIAEFRKQRDSLKSRSTARAVRDALMKALVDHHGKSMSGRQRFKDGRPVASVAYEMGFTDLFVMRSDGTYGFDRTAVHTDIPLPKKVSFGKTNGIAIAGTMFGLPRTPSYNGSMWATNTRASIPATEITFNNDMWEPGHDAMVMPDAQSLDILGCDHDGDKSSCYMYHVDPDTGTSEFLPDANDLLPKSVKHLQHGGGEDDPLVWAKDPVRRREYLDSLVSKGYVTVGRKASVTDRDTGAVRNVRTGYEVSERAKALSGNSVVRGLFAISANREMGPADNVDHDLSGAWKFTRPTKFQPVDEGDWEKLKAKVENSPFNYLKNGSIGDPYIAALVSTSAQSADKARGYAVSYARRLHLAIMSGCFGPDSALGKMFSWSVSGDEATQKEHERLEKWIDFIYGIDGISNATFDDIKEQICLKMGWTPGMLETLFVDIMFSERKDPSGKYVRIDPPTTSKEMYDILDSYITSINEHGSRFHMMISSTPENSDYVLYRENGVDITSTYLHNTYRSALGGNFSKSSLYDAFGIVKDDSGKGLTVSLDKGDPAMLSLRVFADAVAQQARDWAGLVGKDAGVEATKALVDLVDRCSRNGGSNAAVGYVYWACSELRRNADAEDLARGFRTWAAGSQAMQVAKDFTDSFNCFDANPGSGVKTGSREAMAKTFTDAMETEGKNHADVSPLLYAMFVGNMVSYNVGDLITTQGRASLAAASRDEALLRWGAVISQAAVDPALRTYIASLAAEETESPRQILRLEGNMKTVPYFIGALRTTPELKPGEGTDLFSANGGLAAWDAMEAIAKASSFCYDPTSPDAEKAVSRTLGDGSVMFMDGDSRSTPAFLSGVCSMLNVLQVLVSTSSQSYANPGLFYFSTHGEYSLRGENDQDSKWIAAAAQRKDLLALRGLRRITCTMRDKSLNSRKIAYSAINRLENLNVISRRRAYDNKNDANAAVNGRTFAKSFSLTVENLDNLLVELGDTSGIKSSGGMPSIVDDIATVKRILSYLEELTADEDGKTTPVEITASGFVKQILPLYATLTSMTGPADPKSSSIVAYLPGLYARLSREQALYNSGVIERSLGVEETPGRTLVDMLVATKLGLTIDAGSDLRRGNNPLDISRMTPAMQNLIIAKLREAYGDEKCTSLMQSLGGEDNFMEVMGRLSEDGKLPIRMNPEGSHFVDALSGLQVIRSFHRFLNGTLDGTKSKPDNTVDPIDPPEKDKPEDPGQFSKDVAAAAGWLNAALGHSADIEYSGGNVMTVRFRNGLRGTAPMTFTGSADGRADLAITIRFGESDRPGAFKLDINSPYVAASFCQAASGLNITPEQFLTLTVPERRSLMSVFTKGALEEGAAGYSLSMPSWTIDDKMVATLCGEIRIRDPKNRKAIFHEYFHSMIGAFRTLGMFSQEDVSALSARFPKKGKGTTMLFDEEAAADAFATYVETRVLGGRGKDMSDDGVLRKIWNKVIEFLKSMRNMFKYGFKYSSSSAADALFQFVLNGYAAQSSSRLSEVGLEPNVEYMTDEAGRITTSLKIADRFVSGIERDRAFIERTRSDDPAAAAEARIDAEHKPYSDPAAAFENGLKKGTAPLAERQLSDLLRRELASDNPNPKAISKYIDELTFQRRSRSRRVINRIDVLEKSVDPEIAKMFDVAVSNDSVKEGRLETTRVAEYVSSTDGKAWSRAVLRDVTADSTLRSLLTDASATDEEISSAFKSAYPESADAAAHLAKALDVPVEEIASNTDLMMWSVAHQEAIKNRVMKVSEDEPASPSAELAAAAVKTSERVVNPGAVDRTLSSLHEGHDAIIVLDVETTGLFTHRNRLTQITAYKLVQDASGESKVVDTYNRYVRLPTGFRADPGSLETSNLKPSDLDGSRTDIDGVPVVSEYGSADSAIEGFEKFVGDGRVLFVAHNAKFDAGTLVAAFARAGRRGSTVLTRGDWLDTQTVYRDRATFDKSIMSGHSFAESRVKYRADGKGTYEVTYRNRDGRLFGVKNTRGHKLEAMKNHYGITDADVARHTGSSSAHRSDYDAAVLIESLMRLSGERDDLASYINIFGYYAKFGTHTVMDSSDPSDKDAVDFGEANYGRLAGVVYAPQWHPAFLLDGTIVAKSETLPAIVRGVSKAAPSPAVPPADPSKDPAPRTKTRRSTAKGGNAYEFVPPSPEAAEAARKVLSETNTTVLLDPVEQTLRDEFYDSNYYLLGAAFRAAYDQLDEDDRRVLSGENIVYNPLAKLRAALSTVSVLDRPRKQVGDSLRLEEADEAVRGAAGILQRLSGGTANYMNAHTLAVLYKLWDDKFFKQAAERALQRKERHINGKRRSRNNPGDAYRYFVKHRSTKNDLAAALLAAAGTKFGSIVESAYSALEGYRAQLNGVESSDTETVNHLLGELGKLLGQMTPTTIMSDPARWYNALDEFCRNVFSGIERGDYNTNSAEYGPYVPGNDEHDDESVSAKNRAIYNLPVAGDALAAEDPGVKFRQRILHMVADAVFTTAAQVKFCREIGWHPGTLLNDPWNTKEVTAETFSLVTKWLGIGSNELTSSSPIVENSCTPFFVAANLDSLIESSVRESFGNSAIRDLVLSKSKNLRGELSVLTRDINLIDAVLGIDREANRSVLRMKSFKTTHEIKDGVTRALDEGERKETWGFDNFKGFLHGDTTVSLTEDEYRTQVLLAQLARVRMQGSHRLITGVDEIRFNHGMFVRVDETTHASVLRTADEFDWYDLNKRREEFRTGSAGTSLNRFEMALWKIGLNWHGFVTGIAEPNGKAQPVSMNLYDKFVRTALNAASEVFAMQRAGRDFTDDQFNDYVLAALERADLVVTSSDENAPERVKGGSRLRSEGVFCVDANLFEREYVKSSGYAKLTDPKKGNRRADMLTTKFIADRLSDRIKSIWRELRDQPWLNTADMAFLNDFRSFVPAFAGTGAFMAGLRRAESENIRNMSSSQVEAVITRHEDTFRRMLSTPGMSTRSFRDLSPAQLDMIHDHFNTKERGSELLRAFENGKYSRGSDASEDTGLVVENGTGGTEATQFMTIVQQMYSKLLDKYLSILEGRFTGDRSAEASVGRMLREYEAAAVESTGASVKAMGMTDEQLYKRHRSLPANMTAGHAVITMMRGLQNSLYFRSTLINMLLTADERGRPMFYADPGDVGPDAQVVPDEVWGMLAKWWSESNALEDLDNEHRYKYDIKRSGVENARMAYRGVERAWQSSGKRQIGYKYRDMVVSEDFEEMGSSDLNSGTVSHMLVRVNTPDSTVLDKLGTGKTIGDKLSGRGSVALGYVRHLFQAQRTYAPGVVMKTLQHLNAWSKTMAVSLSTFFNIATQWESAIGATGYMATLMSNGRSFSNSRERKSPKRAKRGKTATGLARMAQKWATLGMKEGWIDENFVGFQDIIRMMDTDDPYLADLIIWAESIGITMSDTLNNPMEDNKPIVMKDLERLGRLLRPLYKSRGNAAKAEKEMYDALLGKGGDKLMARMRQAKNLAAWGANKAVDALEGTFNALITRRGEKAFNYALNAVKLAVASQVAMRLKSEAVAAGRSFDPIRDMRGYAEYIDSEVGGVNPLRYAWAHPSTTRFLNLLFFSWQWTRTAWEAGGGGVLEDMVFGGHSASKEQRGVTLSRWARMFLAVQIAFPMLLQATAKAVGIACGYDDDRDKWWTFQNEKKSWLFNANLRPLLMAVARADQTVSDAFGLAYDKNPKTTHGWLGAHKMARSTGNLAFDITTNFLPMYTGGDPANTTGERAMYGRIGKQAMEFPGWFYNLIPQFMSKLSLTAQGALKSVLGVNPTAIGLKGAHPDAQYTPGLVRLLPFITDTATGHSTINTNFFLWDIFVRPLSPFSLATVSTKGDAGVLGMGMPIQYGTSSTDLKAAAEDILTRYASNDRSAYVSSFALTGGLRDDWTIRRGPYSGLVNDMLAQVRADARVNGIDYLNKVLVPAVTSVRTRLYAELFGLLPRDADDRGFSLSEINRKIRSLVRLGATYETIVSSINMKLESRNSSAMSPRYYSLINSILVGSYNDPYGFSRRDLEAHLRAINME